MQLRLARVPSAIAAAVIVLLGVSRPAEAGFSMTLSDGIAADTQVISLTSGGVNTFSATVGHFAVGGVANLTEDPNIADTMTQLTFNIHSNAAAAEIAGAADGRLLHPVQANEVFVRLTPAERAALRAQGFGFYDWDEVAARFVTAWNSDPAHVTALARAVAGL